MLHDAGLMPYISKPPVDCSFAGSACSCFVFSYVEMIVSRKMTCTAHYTEVLEPSLSMGDCIDMVVKVVKRHAKL